ncbi:MAG: DUF3006 domain-containing protein [Clostridia bacterium]|nr:DUF3006 domain-containing protein [Clostridia bacterium]
MQWIIDRVTEGVAVCETEDGAHVRLRAAYLPAGAKEGSVLRLTEAGLALDREAEAALREEVFRLQEETFR